MTAADRYNPERFRIPFSAEVAKSVDAVDSKSTVEIRAGSSPAFGTNQVFFRLLKSIYVYKINQLEVLPLGLGLLKSTVVYQHLPTNDGITVGSFGSIKIDTNTGSGIYGSY